MADNIGSIKDPAISIKPTPKLLKFLKEHRSEFNLFKKEATENIRNASKKDNILLKVTDIEWLDSFLRYKRQGLEDSQCLLFEGKELDKEISKMIQNKDSLLKEKISESEKKGNIVYLHELIEGCELVLPQNEVIERNPILAARIERLRKDQEEREYKAMTRNVDMTKKFIAEDTLSYQMNMMNRHLIAVGQFLLSVAAGFAFGFLGVELAIGDLEFGFRLLLGITCALVIALAEFYFLAKHLSEEEVELPVPQKLQLSAAVNGAKPHSD